MDNEPGQNLSIPPWTCYSALCGFECDGDDYNRQQQHLNWHSMQESRIQTLESMVRELEMKVTTMSSQLQVEQYLIAEVQKVIGIKGNYRFVESEAFVEDDRPL